MGQIERLLVRRSRVVIVICQQLVEVVRAIDPLVPTVLIENAPGSGDLPVAGASASLRAAWGIEPDAPVVLYTGTFEAYQGLDLLYAAAARVRTARPDIRFLVVGGQPDQVEAARTQARSAGADGVVLFTGQRPSEEIPQFLDAATVLASPRSRGTNTPLKIYQYLRAGRPIIATRLLTHTQVLDDSVAVLTEATPEAYAAGILRAVEDPAEADAIGRRARALADTKYSYEAYLERTRHAYAELFGSGAAQVARGVA
jgi:glycosyltransferase involved in cell wall biosynthesis